MDESNTINSEHTRLVRRTDAETAASQKGLLNPRGPYLRWIAVFFMCFLSFGESTGMLLAPALRCPCSLGSYYCYDNPAGLQDVMKDDLKISSTTFTSFYSWYSWPNVV